MKTTIAILATALCGCIPALAAGPRGQTVTAQPDPLRQPLVVPYATPSEIGVQFNLVAMFRQRATPVPTRTRYVEEYRQTVYGSITAQTGGVDDTAGRVVAVEETEEPMGAKDQVVAHFRRNAGRYIAGAVATGGYIAYRKFSATSGGKGDTFNLYSEGGDINVHNRNHSESRSETRTTTTSTHPVAE